jgi:tetratricopeptide (TPR) repeat protein
MKNSAVIFLLLTLSLAALAQKPKPAAKNTKPAAKSNLVKTEKPGDEKAEFERAATTTNAAERIMALQKFVAYFPQSDKKAEAQELVAVARAAAADEKLRLGENESGTELFKIAVKDAPVPFSDKLFTEIILQIPTNLFWRGQQKAALEIAQMIEAKTDGNAKQTLGLATFYLGTENAAEAERLARKAIASDANLPAAYQTLGLAHRINFQLDEAANAYQKALELDPASSVSKRSLAEMKRGAGKPDEAAALYREILTTDSADAGAHTGLILALFDSGKRAEAEMEMSKSLEANPNNLPLLVGAAYWYAATGDGAKAVELATKAVEIEPRYTWAHIALARGFTAQKRPLDAERTLLTARQYGNFPTLDYEIASARFRAGFFREAAEIMRQNFTIKGETVETRLGGRVTRESDNFIELLAPERRASIFQPVAADDRETSEKLKSLLVFAQKLDAGENDEAEIGRVTDRFVEGDDAMTLHRQIYAANRLLQTGKALQKTLEITQSALGKADAALNVASPAAAVLADELYESRALAVSRNQLILVPEVPRQTLSAILRGRVEEIAGWTLYNQNNPAQAVIRLKRAVSVLPQNSAWWRSSMWRLGAALQADGKDKDALDAYLKSYPREALDSARYGIIETLYQKVNGSVEGLDASIGAQSAAPSFVSASAINPSETKPAETTARNDVRPEAAAESRTPEVRPARTQRIPDNVPLVPVALAEQATRQQQTIVPKEESQQTEVSKQEIATVEKKEEMATIEKKEDVVNTENLENTVKPENTNSEESVKPEIKIEAPKEISSNGSKNFNQTPNPVVGAAKSAANAENKPTPEIELETALQNSVEKEKTPTETMQTADNRSTENVLPEPQAKTESAPENTPAETAIPIDAPKEKPISAKTDSASKSLFDPIVINVPQRDELQNSKTVSKTPSQSEKFAATEPNLVQTAKQKPSAQSENVADNSTITRQRVVITDNLPPEKIAPCSVYVNEENISLLNGGGVLGVSVGINKKGDLKELTAVSSSPDDVQVVYEPEIIAPAGQAFYVIKSISPKTGIFTVTFEAPCGKKELSVKVR